MLDDLVEHSVPGWDGEGAAFDGGQAAPDAEVLVEGEGDREEFSSRMPTPAETEGLKVPAGVPVIEVVHTGIDQDERPFEVTCFTMRADLNGLDYRIRIERPELQVLAGMVIVLLAAYLRKAEIRTLGRQA